MKLEQTNARAKTANKVALEAEKEKDAGEKAVEELKRQLQPKTANKVALEAEKEKDAGEKAMEELKRQLQPKRAARTWIPVKWPRSIGVRLYAF